MLPNLEAEFEKRKPWVTKFVINGMAYGGNLNLIEDMRLRQFFECFPQAQTILELGSLEGGHTFGLAQRSTVKRVLGIEGRQANVNKAVFVQDLLGTKNVEFALANLESADLSSFGKFDVVFCSGLLYHLPEPWKLISQISGVSPNLFIWTHYAHENQATETAHGYRGWRYQEHGLADPLSGMSADSFWPTLDSLYAILKDHGFKTFCLFENNTTHMHGPSITLAATAQPAGLSQQLYWRVIQWRWLASGWYGKVIRWLGAKTRKIQGS